MLVIKELLFDRLREQYVGWRILPCPDDVELDTVASWLEQRYGPALNTSWTVTEDAEEVPVGWVYEVPADWPTANRAEQEMVAVPMLVDLSGAPTDTAFLVQAEQRARWERAAKTGGCRDDRHDDQAATVRGEPIVDAILSHVLAR